MFDYNTLLAELKNKKIKRIMVTGPQRSGTTIATKILSHDLGLEFHPEEDFNYISITNFVELIKKENIVVQAPCLSAYCHLFPQLAIVFMFRDIDDIIESQKRVNWQHDKSEKSRYFCDDILPASQIKYDYWEKWQKNNIKNAFSLDYESLKGHNLWLSPEERIDFHSRQIEK